MMKLWMFYTQNILPLKTERTGCELPPGRYEISDINRTLEYLLTDFVKVSITIDDIRLKSNINFNQTLIFTKKSFFLQYIRI